MDVADVCLINKIIIQIFMRIQIDLPQDVLDKLEKLAKKDGRKRKNLIEKIIIDYINKKP